MPDITVMSWNIQNFGAGLHRRYRGDYVPLCNSIAQVALDQNVDILFIMELRRGALAAILTQLRNALANTFAAAGAAPANWQYDSIQGAIRRVNNNDQLAWTLSANHEGYAVFWKNDPNEFIMLATQAVAPNMMSHGVQPGAAGVPAHCLSLVLEGRPPKFAPQNVPRAWLDNNPPHAWQWGAPNYVPGMNWGHLFFPTTHAGNFIHRPSVRRPCYCVIQVTNPPANSLVPILCYHAPSGRDGAAAGTNLSAFSRQLYEVPDPANPGNWVPVPNAIAMGDFNVDGNPPQLPGGREMAYANFTNIMAGGGAEMRSAITLGAADPQNSTHVALTHGFGGPPILNMFLDAYRRIEIDNIFYRGFAAAAVPLPPNGRIYDLISAVLLGNLNVQNFDVPVIQNYVFPLIMAFDPNTGVPLDVANAPIYPQIEDWDDFYDDGAGAGMHNGQINVARAAAEFVKLLISDHLPVSFRFVL